MENMSSALSRRGFVGGTAAAVALAAATGAPSALANAPLADEPEWDETYDVVIVGAGGAGYLAAFAAQDGGASVVVLEKADATGGDTIISDQCPIVRLPQAFQEQLGQDDTLELYVGELTATFPFSAIGMSGGDQPAETPFLERYAQIGPEMIEYTLGLGLDWIPFPMKGTPTAPLPLTDTVSRLTMPSGGNIILPLRDAADEAGIPVLTGNRVLKVYRSQDGRASGVASLDYATGEVRYYGAAKGVVLACGSFCGDRGMVARFLGKGAAIPGGAAGNTGDGVALAAEAGAALRDMELGSHWIPFEHPYGGQCLLNFEGNGIDAEGNGCAIKGILVNYEAKRFVAESLGYSRDTEAIYGQPNHEAFYVFDAADADKYLAAGVTPYTAESLEELAPFMQVDPEALTAEVDRWNGFVDAGADGDFGAYMPGTARIESAPFYAVRIAPRIYYTYGGVEVDVDGHVLDDEGAAIPGLYAAGSVTGSFAEQEGVFYQGGLGQALSFGMQAGRNAAAGA